MLVAGLSPVGCFDFETGRGPVEYSPKKKSLFESAGYSIGTGLALLETGQAKTRIRDRGCG
jgi:hypothetical protein